MPPRFSRGPPSPVSAANQLKAAAPFHPLADTTTYKDLLLFEERLKMNAQMLGKRKRRYEAFLVVLVASIAFLANRTVYNPSEFPVVRYFTQALLAVALVTLVLFFASGMYQERIRYANRYVPHANRSLRTLNMHLNMRRAPRRFSSLIPWYNPTPSSTSKPSTKSTKPPTPTPQVLAPIPMTNNPRGELIFSSRVDRPFKEGYERYRSAFERRREEKIREKNAEKGVMKWMNWTRSREGSPALSTSSSASNSGKTGMRRSETPPLARRGTPPPSDGLGGGRINRSRSVSPANEVARQAMGHSTRLRDQEEGDAAAGKRARSESYSFIFDEDHTGIGGVKDQEKGGGKNVLGGEGLRGSDMTCIAEDRNEGAMMI